jgi:ligand-binding sensor domain-containing protein
VHISKQTGELPNNKIYCAMTDSKGLVWFGTDNGAIVWNGTKWILKNERNSSLYNRIDNDPFYISSMACDKNGVKYFGATVTNEYGSTFGLMTFDGEHWKNYDKATSGFSGVNISSIVCEGGYVWALSDECLNRFDNNNWKHFALEEIKNNNAIPHYFKTSKEYIDGKIVNCKVTDKEGRVWVGTNSGLYKNGKPYTEFLDNITAITIGADNKIYAGTTNNGIYIVSTVVEDAQEEPMATSTPKKKTNNRKS